MAHAAPAPHDFLHRHDGHGGAPTTLHSHSSPAASHHAHRDGAAHHHHHHHHSGSSPALSLSSSSHLHDQRAAPEQVFAIIKTGRLRAASLAKLFAADAALVAARDADGSSLLHWSALFGDVALVQACLDAGTPVNAATAKSAQTPLMWAAINGHTRAADVLISAGADLDAVDSQNASALLLATQNSSNLAWLLLLERGADVLVADNRGCTSAHWAAYTGNLGVLRMIFAKTDRTLLVAVDADGLTPLHRAARAGRAEAVSFFLNDVGLHPIVGRGGQSPSPWSVRAPPGSPDFEASTPLAMVTAIIGENANAPTPAVFERGVDLLKTRRVLAAAISARELGGDASDALSVLKRWRQIARAVFASPIVMSRSVFPFIFASIMSCSMAVLAFSLTHEADPFTRSLVWTVMLVAALLFVSLRNCDTRSLVPAPELGPDRWHLVSGLRVFRAAVAAAQQDAVVTRAALAAALRSRDGAAGISATVLALGEGLCMPSLQRAPHPNSDAESGVPSSSEEEQPLVQHSAALPASLSAALRVVRPHVSTARSLCAATMSALASRTVAVVTTLTPSLAAATSVVTGADVNLNASVLGRRRSARAPASAHAAATPGLRLIEDVHHAVDEANSAADLAAASASGGSTAGSTAVGPPPRFAPEGTAAAAVLERVCFTCMIVRPLRSKHCSVLDRCYERFDHHCPWTGTVIAEGNHVKFVSFSACMALGGLLLFILAAFSAARASVQSGGSGGFFGALWVLVTSPLSRGALALVWLLHGTLLPTLVFAHIRQSAVNLTTNEALCLPKYAAFRSIAFAGTALAPAFDNPFDRGSSAANLLEWLGVLPRAPVTMHDIIDRDARAIEGVAREMHAAVVSAIETRLSVGTVGAGGGAPDSSAHDNAAADPRTPPRLPRRNSATSVGTSVSAHHSPSLDSVRTRVVAMRASMVAAGMYEALQRAMNGRGSRGAHAHGGDGGGGGGGDGHAHASIFQTTLSTVVQAASAAATAASPVISRAVSTAVAALRRSVSPRHTRREEAV